MFLPDVDTGMLTAMRSDVLRRLGLVPNGLGPREVLGESPMGATPRLAMMLHMLGPFSRSDPHTHRQTSFGSSWGVSSERPL